MECFVEQNAVGTPGIILEHSFHTNTRANKNGYPVTVICKKLAKAEAECIASYLWSYEKGRYYIYKDYG